MKIARRQARIAPSIRRPATSGSNRDSLIGQLDSPSHRLRAMPVPASAFKQKRISLVMNVLRLIVIAGPHPT